MNETLELRPAEVRSTHGNPIRKTPPSMRGSTLWRTLRFTIDPEGFFADAHDRYGDVFMARVLGLHCVVIADPDAVKELFSHGPEELDAGIANQTLSPLLGTGNLLLLDGEEHLHRRRIMLPPFHGERMRAYDEVIRAGIRKEIAAWPLDEPVAALPRMQALTFEVIMQCVFGVEDNNQVGKLGEALRGMLTWVTDARRILLFFMLGPQRIDKLPGFRREVERVDREILAEVTRRRALDDLNEREDILSLLIGATDEDGNQLSNAELRDELITLLIAGYETTSTLLSWAIHDLARDLASQDRLAEEGGTFCDAVITEALRLHPPTGGLARRLRKPLSIGGYELPTGTNVVAITLIVHRRADIYPNPWTFDPTRFLDCRPPAGGWFPFGGSVRRCIGASFAQFEAKIVLDELTTALRLEAVEQRPERTGRRALGLVPAKGARVIAKKR